MAEIKERMQEKLNAVINELHKMSADANTLHLMLAAWLGGGHILLQGLPGVGKTTLAQSLAAVFSLPSRRIQFTSDMLPADITGTHIYHPNQAEFIFHPGAVFNTCIIADELNRAPARVQSALLEAMAEKQVSLDGKTYSLPQPFLIIATQNPSEQRGTYPLPESQLDRFAICLNIGYPSEENETAMISGSFQNTPQINGQANLLDLQNWQQQVANVYISDELATYIYRLIKTTREDERLQNGLSPRAGLDLAQVTRAWAFLHQRHFALPEDVQAVWQHTVTHRLHRHDGLDASDCIIDILQNTKV